MIDFFRSILSNTKQKRLNHIQQQSTQPVILTESSTSNHPPENSSTNSESDPRSLLGKYVSLLFFNPN